MNAFAYFPEEAPAASKWKAMGARSDRSEIQIQRAFRKLAKAICPKVKIVAVPNGTHIASHAGRKKANDEGRTAGFPDVVCMWAHGSASANVVPQIALIEFKAGSGGTVSDPQNEMLDWLQGAGFACVVSRHEDHAIEFLRGLGAPFVDRRGL